MLVNHFLSCRDCFYTCKAIVTTKPRFMSLWKDFANKMKNKRAAKGKNPKDSKEPLKDELIVQRMSSDVSGKAQKYSRIGPREFVPFDMYEELTLQNIIDACQ